MSYSCLQSSLFQSNTQSVAKYELHVNIVEQKRAFVKKLLQMQKNVCDRFLWGMFVKDFCLVPKHRLRQALQTFGLNNHNSPMQLNFQ